MTTALELIDQLRNLVGDRPTTTQLDGAIVASDTNVTMTDGSRIAANSVIECDLEQMLVTEKPSTNTATVIRGYRSSGAAAHDDRAQVIQGFQHDAKGYLESINKALAAIGQGYGRVVWDSNQSFGSGVGILSVPLAAERIFEVGYVPSDTTTFRTIRWQYLSAVPDDVSSTNRAVRLIGATPTSGSAYIGYEAQWTRLEALDDTLDAEFPLDSLHVIMLGAQAYLADGRMFERSTYLAPHVDLEAGAAEVDAVRLVHNTLLQRFIQERSELIARYGNRRSMAWVKG